MNDFAEPQPMSEPIRGQMQEVVRLRNENPVPELIRSDYKDFFRMRTAQLLTDADRAGRHIPAKDCIGKIYGAEDRINQGTSLWVIDKPLTDPTKIKAVAQELADEKYCLVSMMRGNNIGRYTDEPMTRYETAQELLALMLTLKEEFPAGAPVPTKPLFYFRHRPTQVQMIGHEKTWQMARELVDIFGVTEDELIRVMDENYAGYAKRIDERAKRIDERRGRSGDGVMEKIRIDMATRRGLDAETATWDEIRRTSLQIS